MNCLNSEELQENRYRDVIKLFKEHWNKCIEIESDYSEWKNWFHSFILLSIHFQPACII